MDLKEKLISLSKIFKAGFTICYDKGVISQFHRAGGYVVSYKLIMSINTEVTLFNVSIPDNCIIGGWKDKDTGIYYIDINKVYYNLQLALYYAKQYNQKAIWDIKNNKEIKV